MLGISLGLNAPTHKHKLSSFAVSGTLNALFIGQSNIYKMSDNTNAGFEAFKTEAENYFATVTYVNGAKNGAALSFLAEDGNGAYLASGDATKGTVYTTDLEGAMTSSGLANADINYIVIGIGETDFEAIEREHDGDPVPNLTEAQHKNAFENWLDLLRSDFPNAHFMLIPRGADDNGTQFTGWGRGKRAQWEIGQEQADVTFMGTNIDLPLFDDKHYTQAGYEAIGARVAKHIAYLEALRDGTGLYGPSISGTTLDISQNRVFIDITHADGTDITVTDTAGLLFDINGTLYSASFVVKETATQIRTRPNGYTLQNGDEVQVLWDWGTLRNFDRADICLDDTGRALEPDFGLALADPSIIESFENAPGEYSPPSGWSENYGYSPLYAQVTSPKTQGEYAVRLSTDTSQTFSGFDREYILEKSGVDLTDYSTLKLDHFFRNVSTSTPFSQAAKFEVVSSVSGSQSVDGTLPSNGVDIDETLTITLDHGSYDYSSATIKIHAPETGDFNTQYQHILDNLRGEF